MRDYAVLPLQPLMDLTADAEIAPSVPARVVLEWARARQDTLGWHPDQVPAPELRPLLVRAGALQDIDEPPAPAATEPGELAWAARLALQLGQRARCAALARRVLPDAPALDRGWAALLGAMAGDAAAPDLDDAPAPVAFAASLYAADRGDPAALDTARALVAGMARKAPVGVLAAARLLRRELAAGAADPAAVTGMREALTSARAGTQPLLDVLLQEAELGLLLAATAATGQPAEAEKFAAAAAGLDPTGAPAQLAVAAAARARGRVAEARAAYLSAARLGLCERTAALTGLLELDPTAPTGPLADLMAQRRDEIATSVSGLPGTVADTARWIAAPTPHPLPIERYRAFLDLQPPALAAADAPPVTNHTPLLSLAAVVENREPWFREIHPQRATAAMFRAELERTAAVYGHASAATSATFSTWLDAPDGCPPELRERIAGAADLPLLDRALLGRLVSAVGFHAEARDMLPGPDVPAPAPTAAYALASWIFAEQMLTTGHQVDLDPAFRTLYAQLGDDPRYLRMKVVASINATVNAARLRQADTMRWWRAEGEHTLAAYRALPEVDEFSGLLMTSRWFRSMGFLPFVTGDRELLRADLDQWLGIATELLGATSDHEAIIAADNYFPAVETAVRTHTYLGEHAEALRLVERLATEIDPVDAKTWLELGELRHQAGDVTGARDAYLHAAHLEFPYGRLSWFNAGQCHEQLGEFEDAVECYRRSLEHWPTGVSPLRRIRDLHARGVLGRDSALIAAWARRQPAWDKLPQIPQPA